MNVDKWTDGLLDLNKYGAFKFIIGNGEAFNNLDFLNIVNNISDTNTFVIASNLISHIDNFKIIKNYSNVSIASSFHPHYWNINGWIDAFCDKIKLLSTDVGVDVCGINVVAYPLYFDTLKDMCEELTDKSNIKAGLIHFYGKYGGLQYPHSYSLDQLRIMDRINGISNNNIDKDERLAYLNSKGHLCYVGNKYVFIMKDGQVWSCYSGDNNGYYLGDIFKKNVTLLDGPKPCLSQQCGCEMMWNEYAKPLILSG